MLENYLNYIKNNPEGYWFKAKLYGWGWMPATWQGWTITLVYMGIVLVLAFNIDSNLTEQEALFSFFIPILVLTFIFIAIAYIKGEKPTWRWGPPKEPKEEE